jgi:hypothetical protein
MVQGTENTKLLHEILGDQITNIPFTSGSHPGWRADLGAEVEIGIVYLT